MARARTLPSNLFKADNVQTIEEIWTPHGVIPAGVLGVVTDQRPSVDPATNQSVLETWIWFRGQPLDTIFFRARTTGQMRKLPQSYPGRIEYRSPTPPPPRPPPPSPPRPVITP